MAVVLLPDVERITVAYLLTRVEVTALASTRVYTEVPSNPTVPLVRLTRVGGAPVRQKPLYHDAARLQVETYGGSKKTTRDLAETVRACLFEAPAASHADGSITAVTFGELLWLPDETWLTENGKARPRYVHDCTVYVHP